MGKIVHLVSRKKHRFGRFSGKFYYGYLIEYLNTTRLKFDLYEHQSAFKDRQNDICIILVEYPIRPAFL